MPVVKPATAPPGAFVEGPARWVMDGHALFADVVGSNYWAPVWQPEDPERMEVTITVHAHEECSITYAVDLGQGALHRTFLALLPPSAILPANSERLAAHARKRDAAQQAATAPEDDGDEADEAETLFDLAEQAKP